MDEGLIRAGPQFGGTSMATAKQLEANRANALLSAGPRTAIGKAVVARNAVKHGLTSVSPVVAGLECEADWQALCDGMSADLAPQGSLEAALAERVTLSFWRLQRVARYETGIINVDQEAVAEMLKSIEAELRTCIEKERLAQHEFESSRQQVAFLELLGSLPDNEKVDGADVFEVFEAAWNCHLSLPAPDPNFAALMGLPAECHEDAWEWDGWTAGLVRQIIAKLAARVRLSPEGLLGCCMRLQREILEYQSKSLIANDQRKIELARRHRETESRLRRTRMLPDDGTSAKIGRYEQHLSKQLSQALHELERVQARRRGRFVTPPMVLDVNINGTGSDVG